MTYATEQCSRRNVHNVWKKSYFKKSRVGCAECTDQKLFAMTLNPLRMTTKNAADHFALKPTATITHATSPTMDTKMRPIDHDPWIMNPKKRNMRRTRPASKKLEWK